MPLIHSKSKKAFSKNIEAEMRAGKPQKQSIAIAYSVKRKAGKKKMAEGGSISASDEKRPMPDDLHDDSMQARQNKHMRSNGEDNWLDQPTVKQSESNDVRGKKLPIKRPKMVPTNAFSTRLYDKEGNLEDSAKPGPYGEQPESWENEEDAKASGHPVRDMEDEHSTGRRPYAEGGKVESDLDHGQKRGPQGYPKYQEQAQNEKGVHTPVSGVTAYPGGKGTSEAGNLSSETYAGKPHRELRDYGKQKHKEKLEEMRKMPNPKLKGLARGGKVNEYDHEGAGGVHLQDPSAPQGQSYAGRGARSTTSSNPYEKRAGREDSADYHGAVYREKHHLQQKAGIRPLKGLADGGEVESEDYEHPDNKYEHDMYNEPMSQDEPSEDEGDSMAMSMDEEGPDRQGDEVPDMEREHSNDREPYADGGEISRSRDDSEDQPHSEEDEEHHNSIAAAIMARRNRMHSEIDSGAHDMDIAVKMAEGGEILDNSDKDEILSHGSMDSDDSDQADLSRNHDEDANEEDQASFNALRKENYNSSNLDVENPKDSAEMGDSEEEDSENKHDAVSAIRRKMRMRRQFSQD